MTARAELAILGASPAFAHPLHVGRPNIGDRASIHHALDQILDARWLTNDGPMVQAFERQVAAIVDADHCIAVVNATIGMQLLLQALDVRGEVILPSFTFIATAHAIAMQGLTPVFADIDADHHLLDPNEVEAIVGGRTGAIVGVHLWGQPCDDAALGAIARARHVPLIYDAAHAFGSVSDTGGLGRLGTATVFSLHATKMINAFEGGAIVTDDAALARELRLLRNFGFAGLDDIRRIGTNAKMSEISAAMGIASLARLDEFLRHNYRNRAAYEQALLGLPGVTLQVNTLVGRSNAHYVVLQVDETCPLTRDEVMLVLHAENVLARRYFSPPCHLAIPYRDQSASVPRPLPNTVHTSQTVLCLPTGTAVDLADIQRIGDRLRTALHQAPAVRAVLRRQTAQSNRP